MDAPDQPNSIIHVRAIEMYQLTSPLNCNVAVPFALLNGEEVKHVGKSVDGLLVLTNYRLYLQLRDTRHALYDHHVPLGLIESVEHRDLFYLHIGCKDARTYRCTFDTNELCMEWFGHLLKAYAPPAELEQLFAFFYYAWAKETDDEIYTKLETNRQLIYNEATFKSEVDRLKFDLHGAWRISAVNKHYKLCPSYPPLLLVPACISDETLETVAKFRSSRRIPTIVWRHPGNGAVVARCSQPEVGWLGWRSAEDEDLLKAISDACTCDTGSKSELDHALHWPTSNGSETGETQSVISMQERKKVLIMDARSYTTAVANRARGGGCECPEYYPNCEMQFMNLANIHSIRKSFHALRQLCTSPADQPNYFSLLEGTRWLQHMSGLMKAAVTLVNAVEREARPVLVHCSDGWDRTPQIVALAELLLDPFYRTLEGFRILIEREWLAFGHKFADRCGHGTGSEDPNERCPVFVQWLDCVHQLLDQFPCAFQFSHIYLVKLVQHTYSTLFGTFLCNTKQERVERVNDNTFSVWSFLNAPCFTNHLYAPPTNGASVLWPQCNVCDLHLWEEAYRGLLEMHHMEAGVNTCPGPPTAATPPHMIKTRSYGDLVCAIDANQRLNRRKSDPSITVDTLKMHGLSVHSACDGEDLTIDEHSLSPMDASSVSSSPPGQFLRSNGFDPLLDTNCSSDCIYKVEASSGAGAQHHRQYRLSDDSVDLMEASRMHVTNGDTVEGEEEEEDVAEADEEDVVADEVVGGVDVRGKIDAWCTAPHATDASFVTVTDAHNVDTNVINTDKTETVEQEDLRRTTYDNVDRTLCNAMMQQQQQTKNHFSSIYVRPCVVDGLMTKVHSNGDINHNGDVDADATTPPFPTTAATLCTTHDDEEEEVVDGESARATCDTLAKQDRLHSVETSTETLISDKEKLAAATSRPSEVNGVSKTMETTTTETYNGNADVCKACMQNIKLSNGKHSNHHPEESVSGRNSRYSTPPPIYSRTSSCNEWINHLDPCASSKALYLYLNRRGDDGLLPLRSPLQERLWQIIQEHKKKEEALQKELHLYRQILIKRVCHQCNHNDKDETSSIVESTCSAGEGQASAVESLRSDKSWETLEGNGGLHESGNTVPATLWVPDHAVSRCTGCQTQFWLVKRKHHCRNCGRIFCAECTENTTPLPSEQLYKPVRVCTSCYSKLRMECNGGAGGGNSSGVLPEQCKHAAAHAHSATSHAQPSVVGTAASTN